MEHGVTHNTDHFAGYRGIKLFYQAWIPENADANILIVHGIGEHSSRYAHVGRYFSKLGFAVYAYDQRGNGRSAGRRGHIKEFEEYTLDLKRFVEHLSLKKMSFVLGHSLGGLVTIRFAIDYPKYTAGIIAVSPALRLSMKVPVFKKLLAYTLRAVYPAFAMMDHSISSEYLSHDKAVCDAYDRDPLVHRVRSCRFFTEFLRVSKKTLGEPEKLVTPSLFLQAGDDKIVSVEALEKFYAGVGAENKRIKIYPRLYHEILNEADKNIVLEEITAWIYALMR